jgi:hypothetical protein
MHGDFEELKGLLLRKSLNFIQAQIAEKLELSTVTVSEAILNHSYTRRFQKYQKGQAVGVHPFHNQGEYRVHAAAGKIHRHAGNGIE